jgi:hypothetical protein
MGYILNTTSDVAGLVIMYWFGVFRQSPKNSKRYRLALALLPAEIVAVGYSWYFGYLQLLLVLPAVIQGDVQGVARVSAGFIPLLLAFIGFAQSLLAGKWESEPRTGSGSSSAAEEPALKPARMAEPEPEPVTLATAVACERCGKEFGTKQALNAHRRWCKETGK